MANYQLEQTGAEVQALLNAVESPDTTPAAGSSNLITSGAVQAAVAGVSAEVTALGQQVDEKIISLGCANNLIKLELSGLVYDGSAVVETTSAYNSIIVYIPAGIQTIRIKGINSAGVTYHFFSSKPQVGDSRTSVTTASETITTDGVTTIPYINQNATGIWLLAQFNTTIVSVASIEVLPPILDYSDFIARTWATQISKELELFSGDALTATDTSLRGYIRSSGRISSGYTHYWINKFDVTGRSLVFATGLSVANASCLAAVYDSSDKCLGIYQYGFNKSYDKFPLPLPENASYVLVVDRDKNPQLFGFSDAVYADVAGNAAKAIEIGENGVRRNFTSDDLCGMMYDSSNSKVGSGGATYDGFLFKLSPGQHISWIFNEHNCTNAAVFSSMPIVGSNAGLVRFMGSSFKGDYIAQEGDAYLLVSIRLEYLPFYFIVSSTGIKKKINNINPLSGKKIICFGDSITDFTNGRYGYAEYLANLSGASVSKVGVGATWLSGRTVVSTPTTEAQARAAFDVVNLIHAWVNNSWDDVEAANDYFIDHQLTDRTYVLDVLQNNSPADVDFVTILAGTNDFSSSVPLGLIDSSDKSQVCGAINTIIQELLTANPRLQIFIFTPPVRWFGSGRTAENWCDVYQNSNNITLKEFAAGIVECSTARHTRACNLYSSLGWNQWNFSAYFRDNDSTHPYDGFYEIAQRMFSFMISNL